MQYTNTERKVSIRKNMRSRGKWREKVQIAIYQISQAANAARNLDELYPAIHSILSELMPATNFYFSLHDSSTGLLSFPYFIDEYDECPEPQLLKKGLTEYVLLSGKPLFANPEVFVNLVKQGIVESVGAPSVDWLGVPLKVEERTIGVMVVQTYTEGVRYDDEDLHILEFVSSQVAMAIERKKAEEALRESERFLASIYSSIQDGLSILDTELNILSVNATMEKWYSHAVPLVGKKCYMAYHGRIEPCLVCPSRDTLKNRTSSHEVVPKVGAGGERTGWLDIFSFPFLDTATGQLKGVIEYVRDITEQRQAEDALRKSESRYRGVFEDSPVSLWEEDLSGVKRYIDELRQHEISDLRHYFDNHPEEIAECIKRIKVIDVNKATLRLYQAQDKDTLLANLDCAFGEDSNDSLKEEFIIIGEGGTSYEGERIDHDLAGNLLYTQIYWSAAAGHEETLSDVIVSILDTTVKKQAEKALLRRAEELAVLHAIATVGVEATDEDLLIERATGIIGATLFPVQFGVLLLDQAGEQLICHPSYRGILEPIKHLPVPLGKGISGIVAVTGKSWRVDDVTQEATYIECDHGNIHSELCVPLKIGENVIGVVNAESTLPGAFTEADEHLLKIFAGQLATAINRLRAEESERQQAQQLATIYGISQEIVGTSLEPEQVYITIHKAVSKLMPSEAFVITLVDEASGEIDVVYQIDKETRYPPSRMPANRGLSGHVISTGKSLLIDDFSQSDKNLDVVYFGEPEYTRALIVVPMQEAGKIIGTLSTQSYQPHAYNTSDLHLIELLAAHAAIALGNARMYEETLRRAEELAVLVKVSSALRIAPTRGQMLPIILNQLCQLLKTSSAAILLKDALTDDTQVVLACGGWEKLIDVRLPAGSGVIDQAVALGQSFQNVDIRSDSYSAYQHLLIYDYLSSAAPLFAQHKIIGALWVGSTDGITNGEFRLLTTVADIAANAIHRSTLHEQTQQHAEQMATVSVIGRELAETFDITEIYTRLATAVHDLLPDINIILVERYDLAQQTITYEFGIKDGEKVDVHEFPTFSLDYFEDDPHKKTIHTRSITIVNEILPTDPNPGWLVNINNDSSRAILFVPLLAKGEVLGIIQVRSRTPNRFTQNDVDLLTLVANTAAIAIENARLFTETEKRLQHLAALRAMNMAISSSFDLHVTLNVLLDQVIAQLGVDAATVLLLNEYTQTLEYAAGRGFRGVSITRSKIRLDEDLAGRTALERRLISNRDYPQSNLRSTRLSGEEFVTYFGAPLIAKGQLKGVLEIFHRSPLTPDTEWLEFLETLAGDAAIAIDNATLFNESQRTNIDLTLAYDITLEGWSRVLALHTKEPDENIQRMVDLSLNLGRVLGVPESELVHIRRGVLLHDIGMLGVPDYILHKPDSLTTEDWEIVWQHPLYAYEILSVIPYLAPALEIPHFHHEKWDGSGYPGGLREQQVPIAARIFSVIDVWNSMLSPRSYRPAWSQSEVMDYIRSQSGKHFDPQVVSIFVRLMAE